MAAAKMRCSKRSDDGFSGLSTSPRAHLAKGGAEKLRTATEQMKGVQQQVGTDRGQIQSTQLKPCRPNSEVSNIK